MGSTMASPFDIPDISPEEAAITEQYLDDYIAGKIPRYANRLRLEDDDWEQQVQKVPLFMNRAPTAEDVANNPDLAGLAAIAHEEDDPEDTAEYYRKHGNLEYQKGTKENDKKALKQAVEHYTKGIDARCTKPELNAALLNNRAAANLALGNNRSAANDCTAAHAIDPKNVKTYFRAAKALLALAQYPDALRWCDEGLELEPDNQTLIKLRKDVAAKRAAEEKRRRKQLAEEKAEADQMAGLMAAISGMGIRCRAHPDQKEHAEYRGRPVNLFENASGKQVYLDRATGALVWPVMLLYPEYDQSDFIAEFNDASALEDHFEVMFAEPVVWDRKGQYRPGNLDVFFEHVDEKGNNWLCQVDAGVALRTAMQHRDYVVTGGIPQFVILPKDSTYRDLYFSRYKGLRKK